MLSRTFRILLAAAAFMAVGLATQQSAFAEPFYQGPKKCQECHGDEFKVWEGTKHFTSLKTAHKSKKVKPKPITKAVGALSGSGDSEYKAAQEKRKADAETALAAVKSVAEAAALVADPTEANAQALVDAIAGKDLSGEVGGLLPDPATYK